MKKTASILSTILLTVAGILAFSCSKLEDEQISTGRAPYILSVSRGEATKALTEKADPLSLSKTFAAGEKISLVYKVKGVTKVKESAALTSDDIKRDGKFAEFTFSLTEMPDANSQVKYIYPASMAKSDGTVNYDALNAQDGLLSSVAANLDLGIFEGTLDGTTLPEKVTLTNAFIICKFAIKEGATDMTSSVTELTIRNGSDIYRTYTSSLDEIWVAMKPITTGDIEVYAAKGKDLYTKTVSDKSLEAGMFYPITVTTTQVPGAISGLFSINSNGDWVCFSQGNLRAKYENSAWVWAFADDQWAALHSSQSNAGGRDLFCWGTKTNPGNTNYTSSTWAEWGENPILNGGNTANSGWRTLTGNSDGQWYYIFNTRTTLSGARFAKAQVNDVNGVILLPDDWNTSYYSLASLNSGTVAYETNIISEADWENDLEAHGAVFLPVTGDMWNGGYESANDKTGGFYWSSTAKSNNAARDLCFTKDVNFGTYKVNATDDRFKNLALAVRLVRDL